MRDGEQLPPGTPPDDDLQQFAMSTRRSGPEECAATKADTRPSLAAGCRVGRSDPGAPRRPEARSRSRLRCETRPRPSDRARRRPTLEVRPSSTSPAQLRSLPRKGLRQCTPRTLAPCASPSGHTSARRSGRPSVARCIGERSRRGSAGRWVSPCSYFRHRPAQPLPVQPSAGCRSPRLRRRVIGSARACICLPASRVSRSSWSGSGTSTCDSSLAAGIHAACAERLMSPSCVAALPSS